MKKFFLLTAVLFSMILTAQAQGVDGTKNAIGVRGGWGVEAIYQRYISSANRIETTLGINRYGFNVAGTYQWMFDIKADVPGQFKWYAGPGVSFGDWSNSKFKNGFAFGILGQIGVEYGFESIPLLLSADYRPGIYFAPTTHFDWSGFALGVKFCF